MRLHLIHPLLLALLLLSPVAAWAQNKKTLEEKRKKLTKEIEITNKLLEKTKQNKTAVYDQFVTLQNQIERRESLIQTMENEVLESEDNINRNVSVIQSLQQDLDKMKEEYGRLIRTSFRRNHYNNPLLYLLSSDNLNQAFRRWLFLRKYNRFRKGQAEAIAFTQEILRRKVSAIEQEKIDKEQLLLEMQGQRGALKTELTDKNSLLKTLGKNEEKLRQELKDKQEAKDALDNLIERVIYAEIAKKSAAETKKETAPETKKTTESPPKNTPAPPVAAAPPPESKPKITPPPPPERAPEIKDEDAVSQLFGKQRGRLPWPVDGGFIARSFGRQKHPTLKNIEITNNGVDIRSSEAAPVKAVFAGKVAGVQYIPGHDYTVILQHGNYYTVYSNLSETNLAKGDQVAAGVVIGRLSTNPISGAAELHFELWREKERLNPALWIK